MQRYKHTAAGLLCVAAMGKAEAAQFEFWGINGTLSSELSEGVAFRTEAPDTRMIGKLNVNGQQGLCLADACSSFSGDPAPNARLVAAKGAYFADKKDNGDLNYRQWSLVTADSKLTEQLTLSYGDYTVKLGGLAFFDPRNYAKDDIHPNTNYQPAKTPRSSGVAAVLGQTSILTDAFVSARLQPYEHPVNLSVGYQRVRWGESNFIARGSLSQINAFDARLLRQPDNPIKNVFKPTPLVLLNTPLTENLSLDLLYELGWTHTVADPNGAFNSYLDVANGSYAMLSLGNYSEDPNGLQQLPFPGELFSDTTLRSQVLNEEFGYPKSSQGQGGMKLAWYLPDLNGGTELDFYALNYHSQLPYISNTGAQESCARNATNFQEAYVDCYGFRITDKINPLNGRTGGEPLPLNTVNTFLDYPSNIQMYGFSFNTNLGSWSMAGEYSIRPNMPLQVQVPDVAFAALQPAFPKQNIPVNLGIVLRQLPGAILQVPGALAASNVQKTLQFLTYLVQDPQRTTNIPGANVAVPDYYESYTGLTTQPGQPVHGYVRLPVDQFSVTAIKALGNSENPIGADQVQIIFETGFTHVWDFPDRSELQLEGGDNNNSHASPGVDGTGSGGVPDANRQNPTQQTHGFASSFAWGYRLLLRLEYDNVIAGLNFKPMMLWSQDITGIAPQPAQNFVAGTKSYMLGTAIESGNEWSGQIFYQGSTGGGTVNVDRDRDIIGLSLSYNF